MSLCNRTADQAREAATALGRMRGERINAALRGVADALRNDQHAILAANARDLEAARDQQLSSASIDRLTLTPKRIDAMAQAVLEIAALEDPIGEVVRSSRRPNGLEVRQVRVPLGVIFFLYESRPNVTIDAAALCVKSGNAVILRGGKEAFHSNHALHALFVNALAAAGLPAHAVQLLNTTDRDAVGLLLAMNDRIDLAIPRGGESLIRRVAAEAKMPVLKHFQGICHVYVDADADLDQATEIIVNAKAQRPGVCNAAEVLLVHRRIAPEFLPRAVARLRAVGVELRGDALARALVPDLKSACDSDWDTEFLDLILAVKVVESLAEALAHIARHGSKHTDAIVTRSLHAAQRFIQEVDSSCVVVNASTRFNDGGELGLGAEIGISTDKFHARGPCGLRELTTTKWIVLGDGQIRS